MQRLAKTANPLAAAAALVGPEENPCFDDSGLASECGSEPGDVLEDCDCEIPAP
jgi:hypothetical protein